MSEWYDQSDEYCSLNKKIEIGWIFGKKWFVVTKKTIYIVKKSKK